MITTSPPPARPAPVRRHVREALLDAAAVLLPVRCAGCSAPDRSVCSDCAHRLEPRERTRTVSGITVCSALDYDDVPRAVLLAYKDAGRGGRRVRAGGRAPRRAGRRDCRHSGRPGARPHPVDTCGLEAQGLPPDGHDPVALARPGRSALAGAPAHPPDRRSGRALVERPRTQSRRQPGGLRSGRGQTLPARRRHRDDRRHPRGGRRSNPSGRRHRGRSGHHSPDAASSVRAPACSERPDDY